VSVCLVQYLLANEALPRSLMVTGSHPFWVQDEGWLPARDLSVGSGLQLLDDVEACVGGISPASGDERPLRTRVFNLEIEDCHTYFVGEAGVWVHSEKFETSRLQAARGAMVGLGLCAAEGSG